MGCIFTKKENIPTETVDIESNNQLMENLKFYDKQNYKQKEQVDFYDFHYSGKDKIF